MRKRWYYVDDTEPLEKFYRENKTKTLLGKLRRHEMKNHQSKIANRFHAIHAGFPERIRLDQRSA